MSCLIRGDAIDDRSHQFSESELPAEAKGDHAKLVAAAPPMAAWPSVTHFVGSQTGVTI